VAEFLDIDYSRVGEGVGLGVGVKVSVGVGTGVWVGSGGVRVGVGVNIGLIVGQPSRSATSVGSGVEGGPKPPLIIQIPAKIAMANTMPPTNATI
jgi:hypothetical protein